MGQAKREMEREEEKQGIALSILLKTKALKECRAHPGTYLDQELGLDEAFKHVAFHYKRGEYQIFDDQRDATDSITSAFESFAADECYTCEKHRTE